MSIGDLQDKVGEIQTHSHIYDGLPYSFYLLNSFTKHGLTLGYKRRHLPKVLQSGIELGATWSFIVKGDEVSELVESLQCWTKCLMALCVLLFGVWGSSVVDFTFHPLMVNRTKYQLHSGVNVINLGPFPQILRPCIYNYDYHWN